MRNCGRTINWTALQGTSLLPVSLPCTPYIVTFFGAAASSKQRHLQLWTLSSLHARCPCPSPLAPIRPYLSPTYKHSLHNRRVHHTRDWRDKRTLCLFTIPSTYYRIPRQPNHETFCPPLRSTDPFAHVRLRPVNDTHFIVNNSQRRLHTTLPALAGSLQAFSARQRQITVYTIRRLCDLLA